MPESPSEPLGQIHAIRRSVTLPTKLNPQAQRGSGAPKISENVIFYHPSAKIVHFAPRALVPIPSSSAPSDFDYPVDTIETLPWRSATERTVATAPLRLERVHGLTAFLKCGNVVHAILKNSQCWCVDGVSKFVLRIRPLTYYRIEIPHETEEDKRQVGDLKAALPTILRYEVTPCPFKRAFTVELPEEAMAPRRKKAWKPKAQKERMAADPTNIQSSPAEAKSEWLDSASTGEDTDGATDDSALTPQGTNSTTSEAIPTDDHPLSSAVAFESPTQPIPIRRSVTETPQTFTSLVAKFDAAPIPEEPVSTFQDHVESENHSEREIKPESQGNSASPALLPHEASTPSPIATVEHIARPEDKTTPQERLSSAPEPVSQTEVSPGLQDATEPQPETSSMSVYGCTPTQGRILEPTESRARPETIDPEVARESEREYESDHDHSFSTSPESFHSADLTSPVDSASSHASPIECCGVAQKSAIAKSSHSKETHTASEPSTFHTDIQAASVLEFEASPSDSNAPKDYTTPMLPIPVQLTTRDDPPKPSLSIPSTTKVSPNPATFATSPTTDFNHMSNEFRRRAQATRQRAVSPMPPPSAIYQPSPPDGAASLLSKALTLVLVPPIHLFIILLHIAARIVVNPPANPTPGDTTLESQSAIKDSINEDDFSFPLEREASSDYEDARITKKLDPWDLD
ncbi:uncharacterized protein N7459_000451 [Penicillium hispanicum]|uniref:uncharacterized protein n=1 Tax=Penicillium hispanicum TaxID=1080232 RepID=UPI0025418AFA|nr:uncharacterized protein N7459_000451 [Penicillium hispanicum]KAJ5594243.1 hypothetical protein N7459_000451 [Penicillium hispanicum]